MLKRTEGQYHIFHDDNKLNSFAVSRSLVIYSYTPTLLNPACMYMYEITKGRGTQPSRVKTHCEVAPNAACCLEALSAHRLISTWLRKCCEMWIKSEFIPTRIHTTNYPHLSTAKRENGCASHDTEPRWLNSVESLFRPTFLRDPRAILHITTCPSPPTPPLKKKHSVSTRCVREAGFCVCDFYL